MDFKKSLGDDFELYFGILYSVTSLPNLIFPLIGWYFNVRCGIAFMYVIYAALIMIGQLVLTLGCQYRSILPMIIGRMIFGMGFQMIHICKNQMLIAWFYKSELGFAFSIPQMTVDLTKFGCFFICPIILKTVNLN